MIDEPMSPTGKLKGIKKRNFNKFWLECCRERSPPCTITDCHFSVCVQGSHKQIRRSSPGDEFQGKDVAVVGLERWLVCYQSSSCPPFLGWPDPGLSGGTFAQDHPFCFWLVHNMATYQLWDFRQMTEPR